MMRLTEREKKKICNNYCQILGKTCAKRKSCNIKNVTHMTHWVTKGMIELVNDWVNNAKRNSQQLLSDLR